MKRTLVLAVATLLLAGCSAGSTAAPAPTPSKQDQNESAFLVKAQKFQGVSSEGKVADAQLLKFGYLICKELSAGRVKEEEVLVWAIDNLSGAGVGAASMSATKLCPEWFKG